jgi:hypothetical protein
MDPKTTARFLYIVVAVMAIAMAIYIIYVIAR